MGSCNPKAEPQQPPTKQALQMCCKKLKIHLQMKQNKINQEIIHGQNQLIRKINSPKDQRNKVQQLLLAQRVVNGLKYTAVYTILIQFSISICNSANFICLNIKNQKLIQPWQHKLYSLLYAAQKLPLTTLQDYRKCMAYIENPILTQQYCDPQIKAYLTPQPSPQDMNTYILQMSQRSNIPLAKINEAGHQFSVNFKASNWDNQFKQKSNQFRNSLPKDAIRAKIFNGNQGSSGGNRKSISNPFDKKNLIQGKDLKHNQSGQNEDQKGDNDDFSPNITGIMKKMNQTRGNSFKGE